jgi:hypothetical protein
VNIPLISPLLNQFDIVLVQEDFSFHQETIAKNGQPYISDQSVFRGLVGDGLNILSYCQFENFYREAWKACNGVFDQGSDCLTMKGFTFSRHYMSADKSVDIYDLHMDAGGSEGDNGARIVQTQQLISYVLAQSAGRAVIIAGDFNMNYSDPEDAPNLASIKSGLGLTDSAQYLGINNDRIDKIFFRSVPGVPLVPLSYAVESALFVDSYGQPLSDHEPVRVTFSFQ